MKLSASERASLQRAAERYEEAALAPDRPLAEYLGGRGLLDVADTYRLGYVRTPETGHELMVGRLAIPYLTPAGVVDIRFRCIEWHDCKDHGHPKYLGLPGRQTGMFGVLSLQSDSDVIAVAEGELDAMSLGAAGIPAIGVPGAESWKPHYARCLGDFDRVLVFCDGDEAGRNFGRRVAREVVGATVINLPDGEDCNSILVNAGPEDLRRRAGL